MRERGSERVRERVKTRIGAGGNVKSLLLLEKGFQGLFKFDINILFSIDLLKMAITIDVRAGRFGTIFGHIFK